MTTKFAYLAFVERETEGFETRQRDLHLQIDFCCIYEPCTHPPLGDMWSNELLQDITRLENVIGNSISIVRSPITHLHLVHTVSELLQEKRVEDARILWLYYDALQVAILHVNYPGSFHPLKTCSAQISTLISI